MHHARTIHWAGPNRSKTRSRRAIGFIYYAKRAREDIAAKEAYQKVTGRAAEEPKRRFEWPRAVHGFPIRRLFSASSASGEPS